MCALSYYTYSCVYTCICIRVVLVYVCMFTNKCSARGWGWLWHSLVLSRQAMLEWPLRRVRATPTHCNICRQLQRRMSHGDFSYMFHYVLCLCWIWGDPVEKWHTPCIMQRAEMCRGALSVPVFADDWWCVPSPGRCHGHREMLAPASLWHV